MFTAALLTMSKAWKQKCLSREEWVKRMWCIDTMEYYSALKRMIYMPLIATQMDLEMIILSAVSQTKTNTM